jgi:hypothetical protein
VRQAVQAPHPRPPEPEPNDVVDEDDPRADEIIAILMNMGFNYGSALEAVRQPGVMQGGVERAIAWLCA